MLYVALVLHPTCVPEKVGIVMSSAHRVIVLQVGLLSNWDPL